MTNENNDLQCLLQMEQLRLENQVSNKEQIALINAAILDDKLSHEEVFFKYLKHFLLNL